MEENSNKKIDKYFYDALHAWHNKPSGKVWENIEIGLNEATNKVTYNKSRRRFVYIGLLFLFISGSAIFISNYNKLVGSSFMKLNPIKNVVHSNDNSKKTVAHQEKREIDLATINQAGRNGNRFNINRENINSGNVNINSPVPVRFSSGFAIHSLLFETGHRKSDIDPLILSKKQMNLQMTDKAIVHIDKQPFKDRLGITIYYSKEFAGYSLADDDATAADGKEIEERERNVFSASVGMYMSYRLNKRWVVQSGLSYSWSNSIIDSSTSFAVKEANGNIEFKLNTISGYGYLHSPSFIQPAVGDSVLTAKAYSQLHYLSIPLILSYRFPLRRFSLLIGAGVSFNILTNATVQTVIYGVNFHQDESEIPIKGLKKINYGLMLKAELEYHFSHAFSLDLIPCFKNTLSPINIHSALSAYPYNFGIGVGIGYKF